MFVMLSWPTVLFYFFMKLIINEKDFELVFFKS